jgi:hypothetical protein
MSNNRWLYEQLSGQPGVQLQQSFHPLIVAEKDDKKYRIYTPIPSEYIITVEVVQKAIELGANVISFPTSWCRASGEAIAYGKSHNVQVIPHGRLFEILAS